MTGEPKTWRDIRLVALYRDDYLCQICQKAVATEADHIWPKALGGPDTLENAQAACLACNRSKGDSFYFKDVDPYRVALTIDHYLTIAQQYARLAAKWAAFDSALEAGEEVADAWAHLNAETTDWDFERISRYLREGCPEVFMVEPDPITDHATTGAEPPDEPTPVVEDTDSVDLDDGLTFTAGDSVAIVGSKGSYKVKFFRGAEAHLFGGHNGRLGWRVVRAEQLRKVGAA